MSTHHSSWCNVNKTAQLYFQFISEAQQLDNEIRTTKLVYNKMCHLNIKSRCVSLSGALLVITWLFWFTEIKNYYSLKNEATTTLGVASDSHTDLFLNDCSRDLNSMTDVLIWLIIISILFCKDMVTPMKTKSTLTIKNGSPT